VPVDGTGTERLVEEEPLVKLPEPFMPSVDAPHRMVMIPMESDGRRSAPGAPWEVDREDVIDLQISDTNQASPWSHSVVFALTTEGLLHDWVVSVPGESVIPDTLRAAKIVQFDASRADDRSVTLTADGEVFAWKVDAASIDRPLPGPNRVAPNNPRDTATPVVSKYSPIVRPAMAPIRALLPNEVMPQIRDTMTRGTTNSFNDAIKIRPSTSNNP